MRRDRELWTKVMERFPKLATEATCRLERDFRNKARQGYYERLKQLRDEASDHNIPENRG
jgi:adenine-specific DNA glycosylase